MDELDEAALEAWVRTTRQALTAEVAETGEKATVRRVLDHGSAYERGVLLIVLGHGRHIVVKVGALPRETLTIEQRVFSAVSSARASWSIKQRCGRWPKPCWATMSSCSTPAI
jgi:hypothetical protein